MVERFLASRRWGVYFRVIETGDVKYNDSFTRETAHPEAVPVGEIFRLLFQAPRDKPGIERLLEVPELAPDWRNEFQKRLRLLK